MKKLYLKRNGTLPENVCDLIDLYDEIYHLLQQCVINEIKRKEEDKTSITYSNSTYFKNNKLKDDLDELINLN